MLRMGYCEFKTGATCGSGPPPYEALRKLKILRKARQAEWRYIAAPSERQNSALIRVKRWSQVCQP